METEVTVERTVSAGKVWVLVNVVEMVVGWGKYIDVVEIDVKVETIVSAGSVLVVTLVWVSKCVLVKYFVRIDVDAAPYLVNVTVEAPPYLTTVFVETTAGLVDTIVFVETCDLVIVLPGGHGAL